MENVGLGAGLAAIAFWGFIAACVVSGIWDGIRKRESKHETVRRLIESKAEIDPEMMDRVLEAIDRKSSRPDLDLKITAMWILPVAAGVAVFALILGTVEPDAKLPLLGVAGLLAVMGAGFWLASGVTARLLSSGEAR